MNPFEALATEKEDTPLLKTILQQINKALEKKKMKLKPTRLRKAKDQINRIVNNNVMSSLRQECNTLYGQKKELVVSGAIGDCNKKKDELLDYLKELETKKSLLDAKDARLAKEYKDRLERFEKEKTELENVLKSVSDKSVSIIF